MPKVGGRRKKHRTHRQYDTEEEEMLPKAFVFKKGRVSNTLKGLVQDFRRCMYPNTAMKLEDSSKHKLKDYVKSARQFGVTHLVAYHRFKTKSYVRFITVKGPLITFRVLNYCRAKDIRANVSSSLPFIRDINSPLLVLNNFNQPHNEDLKRIANVLQSMFPPLNMQTVKPEHLKRVISFTYRPENGCIYFRNYRIKLSSSGISRTISELVDGRSKVDLSHFKTFEEYISNAGQQQSQTHTELKQSVKLYVPIWRTQEVGPRLKLKFIRYDEHLNIPNLEEELAQQQRWEEDAAEPAVQAEEQPVQADE